MTILRLTRKRVMRDMIQGVLELNDSKFSCYTLEAKDPRGNNAFNPAFQYAIPEGQYKLTLGHNGAYVNVPFIICKPYKKICICDFPNGEFNPGSIAVGCELVTDRLLDGGMPVMDALHDLLAGRMTDFRKGDAILIVEYASDCIVDAEQAFDDSYIKEMNEEYNFANL